MFDPVLTARQIDALGVARKAFARSVGITPGALSNILNSREIPSLSLERKINAELDVLRSNRTVDFGDDEVP